MGRSSALQAAQNRDRIVDQAGRLFREKGPDAVSVSDVMSALGLTNGGFYKHFASKDALVQEACERSFDASFKRWQDISGSAGGGLAKIVSHYLKERPAEQTCPMLSFGPDMATGSSSTETKQTFTGGAERLFALFSADETEADAMKAKLLFAAMVGAKLLENATENADWTRQISAAVLAEASDLPEA